MNRILRFFLTTIILCISLFAISCTGWIYIVPTGNMILTIQIGDKIVVNKYAYVGDEIKRFDIVVFIPPEDVRKRTNSDSPYAKRIIGLPNEKLEIKDNKIYINDKLLNETFDKIVDENDGKKDYPAIVIPENEYFILGDNRPNSEDSRYWNKATINKKDILGRVEEIIPKD